jgi:hypothetical protein
VAGSRCGLVAQDVTVKDMAGAALVIDSVAWLPSVAFTGGSITGCGTGIEVTNGRLLLDGARIAGNAGMGVRGDLPGVNKGVEIRGSKIVGNGDTGVALKSASEVRISGTTIWANGPYGTASEWGGEEVLSSVSRRSGGLVLWGEPPVPAMLAITGNRIYANGGDQILVIGTWSTWTLDGTTCGVDTNTVGCYDPTYSGTTVSYRGVVAIDAGVVAKKFSWPRLTPSSIYDFWSFGIGTVSAQGSGCGVLPNCLSEDP